MSANEQFMRSEFDYIVYTGSGYFYGKNGRTGVVEFGGPNNVGSVSGSIPEYVISGSIASLPSGRDWMASICIKGKI